MPIYQPASAPVAYLFVDGGALQETVRRIGVGWWPGASLEIDYEVLARGFAKAFFYDAYPVKRESQNDREYEEACGRHDALMERIGSHDGWHAYAGEARHRKRRGLEQKMVDVMITVDMLRHTFNGNMASCTLLTSDLDFKPLLDALVQEGMSVTLWHDPTRTDSDLKRSADNLRQLDVASVWGLLAQDARAGLTLPSVSAGLHSFSDLTFIDCGDAEDGRRWELHRGPNQNQPTLIWPDVRNRGSWLQVSDPSLERVWRFAAEVHGLKPKPTMQTR